MPGDVLSDRAKARLRIAAALMRSAGQQLDFPRAEFYDQMRALLQSMPQADRDRLRAHVDWIEDYDREEARHEAGPQQSARRRR